MSQSSGGPDLSMPSSADYSDGTKVFRFVKPTTGGKLVLCGANDRALGVMQNKPKADEALTYRYTGTSKLEVDATTDIAVGDKIKSDANGKGVKATATGDRVCGVALEAATADGDVIEVQLVSTDLATTP